MMMTVHSTGSTIRTAWKPTTVSHTVWLQASSAHPVAENECRVTYQWAATDSAINATRITTARGVSAGLPPSARLTVST